MPVIKRLSRQSQPKNRDSVRIARSSLDNLMPVIQEQFNNSLSVNALPVLFYHRKQAGIRCTCSIADNSQSPLGNSLPENSGVVALRPDGSGTESFVQTILQGARISIDRYGSRGHEDQKNPQRSLPHSPLIQSDNQINKSGSLNDPFADQVEPFDTSDLFDAAGLATMNDAMLAASADQGCGVCLGSNFVGGYDLLNGWRKVLDTQVPAALDGITIDILQHPNAYLVQGFAGVTPIAQFEITLPLGAIGLDCIRLWNNKQQVHQGLRFEIYVLGEWIELTSETLIANCDGLVRSIRIVFDRDQVAQFTHLELQLDMGSKPLLVDWPKQTVSQDLKQPENIDPVSINISPYVPIVQMFDVIADSTYERLWLIQTVTNGGDREKNIMGWEATARLVQRLEFSWMLFVRRNPHLGDRFATRHQLTTHQRSVNPNALAKAGADR